MDDSPKPEVDEIGGEELRFRLAASPRPPDDPDLFSSNTLFGEPGIYPQGSPMVPAAGGPPADAEAVDTLADLGIADAALRLRDAQLIERVPDVGVRAGLLSLTGTVAEPLLVAFAAGETPVTSIRYGEPSSPGRIVDPPSGAPAPERRVVNVRYRGEHPALLAGSLAHDLLWDPEHAGQYEEATLHALCAMVHVQLRARAAARAHRYRARAPAELARDHVAELASPGECPHRARRARWPRHDPRRCAVDADPRFLEHPVRVRPRGRRRTRLLSSARCSRDSRRRSTTVTAPLRRRPWRVAVDASRSRVAAARRATARRSRARDARRDMMRPIGAPQSASTFLVVEFRGDDVGG